MDQGNIVVTRDAIPERIQSLVDSLHLDTVGKRVRDVQQLGICRSLGHKETVLVAAHDPTHKAGTLNTGVNNGYVLEVKNGEREGGRDERSVSVNSYRRGR